MNELYVWKTVHIVSAAILFGTGLGAAFFCWFGYRWAIRRREIEALRAMLRLTVIADACFTAPAVMVQAATGMLLLHLHGWSFSSPWALAAWALFIFVGLCWLPVVAIQLSLSREAERARSVADLTERFHSRFKVWVALGVPAFLAMILIFYVMVAKPFRLG